MSGKCLECVWRMSSSEKHVFYICPESVWKVFRKCQDLESIFLCIHIYMENVWNASGKCLALKSAFLCMSGKCLESV